MGSQTNCIISVGVNGWYSKGIDRLERSLIYHGSNADTFFWTNIYPEGSPTHEVNPYAFKIYAFQEAIKMGYTKILWLDASFWAVKDPTPIWTIVENKGYYLIRNGETCAQNCNDTCLDYFKVSRDEAECINSIASGIVGINIDNEIAFTFLNEWANSCDRGAFKGSRLHANQSSDARFLHHRQDQSAASLVAHKLNMEIGEMGLVRYYEPEMSKETIFAIRGM